MKTVGVFDVITIAASQRKIDADGYLHAPATISQADNVQPYTARELGLDAEGMDANRIVKLFRPRDEVHDPASVASFEGKPVTFRHPPTPVSSKNWKEHAVGDAHGVHAEGSGLAVDHLIVRDHDAIAGVVDGTCEMSNGYNFTLDMTAGTAPDGTAYDGVQRHIRGNHIAIVDRARGGRKCRIGDEDNNHDTKGHHMTTRNIRVFDRKFNEIEDSVATVLETIEEEQKGKVKSASDEAAANLTRASKAEADLKAEKDKAAKLVADHATEVTDLKAKILSPEQLEAKAKEKAKEITDAQVETLADERAEVVAAAQRLSPGFVTKGVAVAKIRQGVLAALLASDADSVSAVKRVVSAGLGKVAVDKVDAAQAKIVFEMAAASVPERTAADDERQTAEDEERAEREATAAIGGALNRSAQGSDAGKGQAYTASDLQKYRESHGGEMPAWAKN